MEPYTEWSDPQLCILASTRIETLLKQISAFHITKDCQFDIKIIKKRLSIFGETLDDKQEELIDLLETLTEGINDGNDVISAAKENLEQIQRLLCAGNPELAKDAEKAINSSEGMRALKIGLVHEIISLFGPKLDKLDLLFKEERTNYFDEESLQELENICRFHNEVTLTSTRGKFQQEEERVKFLDHYISFISRFEFADYFPFQQHKRKEYMKMKVSFKALRDVLHNHNQSLHALAVKESKLEHERSNLEKDKSSLSKEKSKLHREMAEMEDQKEDIMNEKAMLSKDNGQLIEKYARQIAELDTKMKKDEKTLDDLAARNNWLESQLKELSEKKEKAYKDILELTEERDEFKKKYEALELAKVRKSIDKLIRDSNGLTSDLRGPQVDQEMREQISHKLDKKLADINEIIQKLGAETDTHNPSDDPDCPEEV